MGGGAGNTNKVWTLVDNNVISASSQDVMNIPYVRC